MLLLYQIIISNNKKKCIHLQIVCLNVLKRIYLNSTMFKLFKNICLTKNKYVSTVKYEYVIKVNITTSRYHNNYYNLTDVILSTDVTTYV